jgi:hypothetical protein
MEAFKDFLTKAADLYLVAPAFFNWAAPILVAIIGGMDLASILVGWKTIRE